MTIDKMVLLDARLFIGGIDMSGTGNKIEIGEEWEAKKTTNWRSGGAEDNLAGLGKVELSADGCWEAGDASMPDDAMWASRRVIEPWSAGPTGASDLAPGNLMYLTRALRTKSTILGTVGDVAPYSASAVGSWPLVRGQSAHASGVPRTASGSGTSLHLGALAAGQHMYANLHVIDLSGTGTPTITVKVQSDNGTGFPTPTDRGTFAAKTAIGGEALRIAGPVTDDWWRVSWTITGSTPSFLFLASLGIE